MAEFHHVKPEAPAYLSSITGMPRFAKKFMVDMLLPSFVNLMMFGACEPQKENRLALDTQEKDHLGVPRLKAYFTPSQNDKNMMKDMAKYGKLILKKIGSTLIECSTEKPGGSAIHYAGTCRMGMNATEGVVDSNLKTFDYDNLYICDGSVFPTLPEKGLTFTIMALAQRLSDHLLKG